MRAWLAALASGCLVVSAMGSIEPVLPSWDGEDRAALEAAGWIPGSLLLGDDPPIEGEAEAAAVDSSATALDVEQPTAEDLAADEAPGDEIPEAFWPAYFGERPESFLVDPQTLLGPVESRDRLAFLQYHAGDSQIDLFVYVFRGNQDIPGEVRAEEMMERFFATGRPAAVVHYYLGAPQRSVLHLSPSLTDRVSAAEQRRALESSIMQAFEKVDPARQFEAFLVQMSIRIYWMERIFTMAQEPREIGEQESVRVGTGVETDGKDAAASLTQRLEPVLEGGRRHLVPAVLVVSLGMMGALAGFGMRRRARYLLPDFEVEPRLGGAHGAGIGAVISFGTNASPTTQRDQVPDYLWRA